MDKRPPRHCANPFKVSIPGHIYKAVRWHKDQWLCGTCRLRKASVVQQQEEQLVVENPELQQSVLQESLSQEIVSKETVSNQSNTQIATLTVTTPETPLRQVVNNTIAVENIVADSPPLRTHELLEDSVHEENFDLPKPEFKAALKRLLDSSLLLCEKSPFNAKKARRSGYCIEKVQQITKIVDKTFRRKQKTPKKIIRSPPATIEVQQCDNLNDNSCDSNIIKALVVRFKQCTKYSEKIQVLSVAVAGNYSDKKLANIFNTSLYSIQAAKSVYHEKGAMSLPDPYVGHQIASSTQELVKDFYLRDNVSCKLLTGTRDVIDGQPKRVLLLTISELYNAFKEEYKDRDDVKIGISLPPYAPSSASFQEHQARTAYVCVCCMKTPNLCCKVHV
jgi:hypothetical protein